MTEEKKKPDREELTDEQLEDAAGGVLEHSRSLPKMEEFPPYEDGITRDPPPPPS